MFSQVIDKDAHFDSRIESTSGAKFLAEAAGQISWHLVEQEMMIVGVRRLLSARDEMAPSTPTPDKGGMFPISFSTETPAIGSLVVVPMKGKACELSSGDRDAYMCFD